MGFFHDQGPTIEGKTGKKLWSYRTGSPVWGAAANSYMLDGRQYVLIESGTALFAFAVPENSTSTCMS